MDAGQRPLTVAEAEAYTGLSQSTLRRRMRLWEQGNRSPRALKGGRTHGDSGYRLFDPVDAERARLQRLGELAPDVTTEQWAAMVARDAK